MTPMVTTSSSVASASSAAAGVPLAFLNSAGYGSWSASANVSFWYYGDGSQDFNEGPAGDGDYDVIATLGIQSNY